MHDLDRSMAYAPEQMEGEMDMEQAMDYEQDWDMEGNGYEPDYEYDMEAYEDEYEAYADEEGVFDEEEEMDLAAELLSTESEEELDEFLGRLVKRAARKVRRAVKSPVGRALRRVAKRATKRVLPRAGRAIGAAFGGPIGGAIGGRIGSGARRLLGLELEGMSPEDQEFEVAKRVVRLTGDATKIAATSPASGDPEQDARTAVIKAAKRHAPGLVRPTKPMPPTVTPGGVSGRSGKWIRRGRKIVLIGV